MTDEIRAFLEQTEAVCKKATKARDTLKRELPPQVDYAEMVCGEGAGAHSAYYVWDDPMPYAMDSGIKAIDAMLADIARALEIIKVQAARIEELETANRVLAQRNIELTEDHRTVSSNTLVLTYPVDNQGGHDNG